MKNRVVITGIGPVTQLGIGKDEFIKNLLSGKRKFSQKIPEDTKEKYPVNVYYYVRAVKLTSEQTDRKIKLFSNINSTVVSEFTNDSQFYISEEFKKYEHLVQRDKEVIIQTFLVHGKGGMIICLFSLFQNDSRCVLGYFLGIQREER
ncbi:hypothetical protein [Lactococcus lactis]|uniref:hypothetical protein n=1 Tax=Lactococcus lactis TaxID=1358 RepID=UPI0024A6514B|nr:hypothetical protein [Lactococcus lactis]